MVAFKGLSTKVHGVANFRAPELFGDKNNSSCDYLLEEYGLKPSTFSDVYSFGTIFYHVCQLSAQSSTDPGSSRNRFARDRFPLDSTVKVWRPHADWIRTNCPNSKLRSIGNMRYSSRTVYRVTHRRDHRQGPYTIQWFTSSRHESHLTISLLIMRTIATSQTIDKVQYTRVSA
jgi:hypothetical protein